VCSGHGSFSSPSRHLAISLTLQSLSWTCAIMDLCNHGRLDLNAALAAPSGSMMPLTDSRICRVLQTLKRWTRAFLVLCRRLQRLLEEVVAHEPFVAIVVTEKLRARCTRRRKNTRQGRMEREQTPMGECWHSHITNAHLQVLVSATHTHARTHTHTHTAYRGRNRANEPSRE
jgi:hypothetical protein